MRIPNRSLVIAGVAVALFLFAYAPTTAKAQCYYPAYYTYGYAVPAYYAAPVVYAPPPVVYAPPVYAAPAYYPVYTYPAYPVYGRSWGFGFSFGYRHGHRHCR